MKKIILSELINRRSEYLEALAWALLSASLFVGYQIMLSL